MSQPDSFENDVGDPINVSQNLKLKKLPQRWEEKNDSKVQ